MFKIIQYNMKLMLLGMATGYLNNDAVWIAMSLLWLPWLRFQGVKRIITCAL